MKIKLKAIRTYFLFQDISWSKMTKMSLSRDEAEAANRRPFVRWRGPTARPAWGTGDPPPRTLVEGTGRISRGIRLAELPGGGGAAGHPQAAAWGPTSAHRPPDGSREDGHLPGIYWVTRLSGRLRGTQETRVEPQGSGPAPSGKGGEPCGPCPGLRDPDPVKCDAGHRSPACPPRPG